MKKKPRLGTLAVWAGEESRDGWQRATQVPVVHSVSYGYEDLDYWQDVALGKEEGHIYSRSTNPTVAVFEEKMRQIEGAEATTSFSPGMAAISNTLYSLLKPGDRVVSIKDTYGGTNVIFTEFLPRFYNGEFSSRFLFKNSNQTPNKQTEQARTNSFYYNHRSNFSLR